MTRLPRGREVTAGRAEPAAAAPGPAAEHDESCRVCWGATDEQLISPCAGCRGTSGGIHFSCMRAFYESRARWEDLVCPTCKHPYEGPAAVALGVIGLEVCERLHGQDSPEVARVATNLANAHGRLGDAATMRDLLQRALRIQEREYGPEHREVAVTLTNLGNAHGDLGDAVTKRDLLQRALRIDEREYGPEHRVVAITLTNLGNAHGDLGDAATKRDFLQRALRIQEREYGPEHRVVAITSLNLAQALWSSGEGAQARALMTRACASFVRAYGEGHPHARAAAQACEAWGA